MTQRKIELTPAKKVVLWLLMASVFVAILWGAFTVTTMLWMVSWTQSAAGTCPKINVAALSDEDLRSSICSSPWLYGKGDVGEDCLAAVMELIAEHKRRFPGVEPRCEG